jgi:hypothetical protein
MNQTQPNLLELAKQGNAKAIATLINRQLQPKGITAKAAFKDGCLQIMLEAAQVPNQQALVAFVRKGITSLGAESIEKVKVYGRQKGEDFPTWSEEVELVQPNPFDELSISLERENQQAIQSISVEVEGVNGQIRLTQNRIIISRKGVNAFLSQGLKGDKEIPLSRITAIQFKPVDGFTNGYLQFSIQGGLESTGGLFAATSDENSVMFSELQQPLFEEVKRYIDSVMDGKPINFSTLRLSELETKRIQAEKQVKQAKVKAREAEKRVAQKLIAIFLTVFIVSWIGILIVSEDSNLKLLFGASLIISFVCLMASGLSWLRNSSKNKEKTWYKRNDVIILFLILFYPLGLFLMWRYSKWSSLIKWLITIAFILLIFMRH